MAYVSTIPGVVPELFPSVRLYCSFMGTVINHPKCGSASVLYAPQAMQVLFGFFSKIASEKVFVCASVSEKWEVLGRERVLWEC